MGDGAMPEGDRGVPHVETSALVVRRAAQERSPDEQGPAGLTSASLGTAITVRVRGPARSASRSAESGGAAGGVPRFGSAAATWSVAQARRFLWDRYRSLGGLFYDFVDDYLVYAADDADVTALGAATQTDRTPER